MYHVSSLQATNFKVRALDVALNDFSYFVLCDVSAIVQRNKKLVVCGSTWSH